LSARPSPRRFRRSADRVADGSLLVDALYLDLEQGELLLYEPDRGEFLPA
jgi:hypothetical protein